MNERVPSTSPSLSLTSRIIQSPDEVDSQKLTYIKYLLYMS